jgi:hypothetical protein
MSDTWLILKISGYIYPIALSNNASYTCIERATEDHLSRRYSMVRTVRQLAHASFVIALLWSASAARAQSDSCPGPNKEPHPYGTFTFQTNSRLDPLTSGPYKFGVVSCVNHNDPINPLYVHWLIPGPHGWVPAREKLESVLRMTNNDNVQQLKGCLLYGNRGDTTYGTFFGIDGDTDRVDDETKRGCRAAVESNVPRPGLIDSIFQKFRNFFPSDIRNPQKTMLQIDGEMGIQWKTSNHYISFVSYEVGPYQGSEGSVEGITARPVFRGPTASLLPAFSKANEQTIRIGRKGTIAFEADVGDPRLAYASYDLYVGDNNLVAGIAFPVFVSTK